MPQQVILNLDQMDDPLLGDGTPSFSGGMVSNDQAHLIGETESSHLLNCDRSRLGRITTRKGTIPVGATPPGDGPIIQGMTYYWVGNIKYLVVASGGKLYREDGSGGWIEIATGGVLDNDDIEVFKLGAINHGGGYPVGTTSIVVGGLNAPVAVNDKLIIAADRSTEYTITSHTEVGGDATFTIPAPGLLVAVGDTDVVIVKRLGAKVNNPPDGYPAGTTTINIDGITGVIASPDQFVIKGEEILRVITGHSETAGNTTSLSFTPGLQAGFVASSTTAPIIFALGNNKLFWTDGVGDIFSWDGSHTGNLANVNPQDYPAKTPAPAGVKSIAWFQNRLIAAGPAATPEAIWFSDFLDATFWDPSFNELEVGAGESDPIVTVVPWMDMNLVVFKEHSIYVINMDPSQNPDPTDPTLLVGAYQIKLLTHYIGCASARSVAQVGGQGGDIYFMGSDKQVRSLRRVIAAETQQELAQAVGFPLQDVFDRISPFITNCVAYYWNNRYMLALPLAEEEYPTVVAVFDTSFNNWSGLWTGWAPTAMCAKLLGEGNQVLAIGQSDGTVLQWLEGTGISETDPHTYQDGNDINYPTAVLTRGYTFGSFYNWKTGMNVEFEFNDSAAMITVSAMMDQTTAPGAIGTFDSTASLPLMLPFVLPAVIPAVTFKRIQKDLQRFGQFREVQIYIYCPAGKFSCRSIKITGFLDSVQLQTLQDTPTLDSPMPVELSLP